MPTVVVDSATFSALHLASAAINFARKTLPYGSPNQVADWNSSRRPGLCDGTLLPRLITVRDSVQKVLALPHANLTNITLRTYYSSIIAGIAMYYGAGNCGEHASLTYSFLLTFSFPGLTVRNVSSTVMDHAYCVIAWPGCKDPVVCDAWPSKPQPCLWSQFFANPGTTPAAYREIASHTFGPSDMGFDVVGEAFRAVDPTYVAKVPQQQVIGGLTQQQQYQQKKSAYNHLYTVADKFKPQWFDYSYNNQLLSKAAPAGETWSGKVLPVVTDVAGRVSALDPNARYTGTRM